MKPEDERPHGYLSPQALDGRRPELPSPAPTPQELAALPPHPLGAPSEAYAAAPPQGPTVMEEAPQAPPVIPRPPYLTKGRLFAFLALFTLGFALGAQLFRGLPTTLFLPRSTATPSATASAQKNLVGDGTFSIGGVVPEGTYLFSVNPRGAGTCTFVTSSASQEGSIIGQNTLEITLTAEDGYLSMAGCMLTPR